MKHGEWAFITSHGVILAFIAEHPRVKAADIAAAAGLTERSVRRVIADLHPAGYIVKKRIGWFNCYKVNPELPLRLNTNGDANMGELLGVLILSFYSQTGVWELSIMPHHSIFKS